MGRLKKGFKRVVKAVVPVCLTLSMVLSSAITARADSNDRISAFINLAAGKSITDDTLGNMTFTKDQLRFLGMYCSNFFVPFGTELGIAGEDSETSEGSVEEMTKAITEGLKMSETYAQVFAENILAIARSSATPLVMGYSTGDKLNENIVQCDGLAPNYYNFLTSMMGGGSGILSEYDGSDKDKVSQAKYLYWGYSNGDFTPVFSCVVNTENGYTPSQIAFLKCLESVDITRGYGWSVFDLFEDELESGEEANASGETANKVSILGQTMMVDSFGDIIVKGLQHQYIAVPGCVNPYSWVCVGSDGNDILTAGEAYQIINAQSMSAQDSSMLFKSIAGYSGSTGSSGSSSGSDESWDSNGSYWLFTKSKRYPPFASNLYAYVNARDNKEGTGTKSLNEVCSAIKYLLGYADNLSGSNYSWVVEADKQSDKNCIAIKVTATNEAWNSLDISKWDDSYLNASGRNKDYVAKVKKYRNLLSNLQRSDASEVYITGESISTGETKYNFDKIYKYGRGDISWNGGSAFQKSVKRVIGEVNKKDLSVVDPQETTASGEASTTIKSGNEVYMSKLKGMLEKTSGAMNPNSKGDIEVGSSNLKEHKLVLTYNNSKSDVDKCNLDNKVFDKADGYKATFEESMKYQKSQYKNDKWFIEHSLYGGKWGDIDSWNRVSLFGYSGLVRENIANVPITDCMVFVDNLQQYNFDDGEGEVDWATLPICNYLDDASAGQVVTERNDNKSNTFSAGYSDIESGKLAQVDISETMRVGLYTSYLFAGMYAEDGKAATIGHLGYRINIEGLPTIPNERIDISAEAKSDMMLTSIRDWLYFLLHPTDGLNYFRELITNKLNAFLVGIHNDMNGTFGTGITTGTSAYRNNYGYVTSPDLSEIEWTSSLINFYNNAIPFLIVAMLVTMLFTYITGILSLQKSIFGFALFALFLFLPVNLINNVVGTSNRVSTKLYGDKFTYWALIQQETYSSKIQEAANGESYQNYLRTLYDENAKVYSNQGSESIVLKWQAPKKMSSLMFSKSDSDKIGGLKKAGQDMLKSMLDVSYSGETYLDGSDNVYLYRSYLDISNFSQYIYKGLKEGNRPVSTTITNDMTMSWNDGLKNSVSTMNEDYKNYREAGYANKDMGGSTDASVPLRLKPALASRIVTDALMKRNSVKTLTSSDYVGLNQGFFKFSIPMFAHKADGTEENRISYQATHNDNEISGNEEFVEEAARYPDEDWSSLAVYALNSENVFYYFSWLLYDMGISTSADTNSGFKNLLLSEDEAGFFYNTGGNGEMKDFMDMKSLFTYIIPYMRQCNDLVREWDNTYGIFTYDGVTTDEGHINDPNIVDNPELKQKYWHNLNVARLYNLYCPWVDVMYDCSYTKAEEVKVQGQTFVIEDPLDPSSYPDIRPMVFSKSEMLDYGLTNGDLTKVEKLIMKCEEGMQERLFELLNYHNFNDVTLNTAAAMNCAFVFNETFSENGLFGSNHNIYPQTFELGDFSYDAFLRFILSNTTGEEMSSNNDFYSTIVEKSSTVTALMLILLDIMSIYILPAFKIFFIIAVFLLSVLIILVTAFRVDSEQKFITKVMGGLVKPMLAFLAVTVAFSYIVSLFMGEGNTAVTRTKEVSISMGDPVTVMVAMCAVNIGALVLYWKIIKNVMSQLVREGKLAGNFIGGVVGSVGALAAGAFGLNKLKSAMSGGSGGASGSSGGGAGGSSGDGSGEGTSGGFSPRAKARASASSAEGREDRLSDPTRQNDAKRRTVKDASGNKEKNSEEKKRNIENTTNSGLENIRRSSGNKVKENSVTGQHRVNRNRGKDTSKE